MFLFDSKSLVSFMVVYIFSASLFDEIEQNQHYFFLCKFTFILVLVVFIFFLGFLPIYIYILNLCSTSLHKQFLLYTIYVSSRKDKSLYDFYTYKIIYMNM